MSEINDKAIAQETVENMQAILEQLRLTAEKYEVSVPELYAALETLGISTDISTRVYAMIKQLLITISHVVTSEPDPQQLVSNLFSLNVANMLFYRELSQMIPDDVACDVIIAVSGILFQLEGADAPVVEEAEVVEVDVDTELPVVSLAAELSAVKPVANSLDDEIASMK